MKQFDDAFALVHTYDSSAPPGSSTFFQNSSCFLLEHGFGNSFWMLKSDRVLLSSSCLHGDLLDHGIDVISILCGNNTWKSTCLPLSGIDFILSRAHPDERLSMARASLAPPHLLSRSCICAGLGNSSMNNSTLSSSFVVTPSVQLTSSASFPSSLSSPGVAVKVVSTVDAILLTSGTHGCLSFLHFAGESVRTSRAANVHVCH